MDRTNSPGRNSYPDYDILKQVINDTGLGGLIEPNVGPTITFDLFEGRAKGFYEAGFQSDFILQLVPSPNLDKPNVDILTVRFN